MNIRVIKTRQGEPVKYGSEVQLMHMDSGAFLQAGKMMADIQKDFLRLELSQDPSPNRVIFVIRPRYNYRQEGDEVVMGDHVVFYNPRKDNCIHFST